MLLSSSETFDAAKMPPAELPLSPLAGEMSGRTEGGGRERGVHD